MTDPEIPEPDRFEPAPHPRHTARLYGQHAAEAAVLAAWASGRMHHAWLLSGPRGVGKATLAWRIARFLLATDPAAGDGRFGAPPATSLDVAPDHPVSRSTAALSEPRLFLLRRAWDGDSKRLKTVLTVDEVRRLKGFLNLTATDGGHRVVIVDAADEMNPSSANAFLKMLEEPPARTTLLLVSHQPASLLPTIRSRCRELRLVPLGPDDLAGAMEQAGAETSQPAALAELSGGSVGEAIRLASLDGIGQYARILGLAASLPRLDRPAMLALADSTAQRGRTDQFELVLTLIDLFLARLARTGIQGPPATSVVPDEAAVLTRLSPDPDTARHWAELQQSLGARARQGRAVNLDPAALVIDMVVRIDATAARIMARV